MSDPYNPGRQFTLSSPYGKRRDPKTREEEKFHSGQDFRAREGTSIPAAMAGVVVYSGFNRNLGNTVIVRNNAGEYSLYGHMRDGAPLAQMGQQVWPGDTIGHVGSTGACTTGPHLHYSVLRKGATVSQERPEGGKIGVKLNETNTIDPARYDVALYLDQTLRAQQMMPGPNGTSNFAYSQSLAAPTAPPIASDRPGVPAGGPPFNDRFGNWQSPAPDSSAFAPLSQSKPGGLPALILEQIRREKEQNIAQPQAIPVGANRMPTVPFVSPDDPMSPDHPASFDERFVDPSSVRRLSSRWIASFGAEKHSRDQAQVTQAG